MTSQEARVAMVSGLPRMEPVIETLPTNLMGAFSQGAKLATGVTETAAVLEAAGVTLAAAEVEGEGEDGPSHSPHAANSPQGATCNSDVAAKWVAKRRHLPA